MTPGWSLPKLTALPYTELMSSCPPPPCKATAGTVPPARVSCPSLRPMWVCVCVGPGSTGWALAGSVQVHGSSDPGAAALCTVGWSLFLLCCGKVSVFPCNPGFSFSLPFLTHECLAPDPALPSLSDVLDSQGLMSSPSPSMAPLTTGSTPPRAAFPVGPAPGAL